jgi:hypothetical protein
MEWRYVLFNPFFYETLADRVDIGLCLAKDFD